MVTIFESICKLPSDFKHPNAGKFDLKSIEMWLHYQFWFFIISTNECGLCQHIVVLHHSLGL